MVKLQNNCVLFYHYDEALIFNEYGNLDRYDKEYLDAKYSEILKQIIKAQTTKQIGDKNGN